MAESLASGMDVTSLMNAGGKGDLRARVTSAATEAGLDPNFVHRLVTAESNWNPAAKSKAGATGLMQLMPATAKQYGVTDLTNLSENIKAGIAHLKRLKAKYGDRDDLIAAAYNAGEGPVDKAGGVPKIAETQAYVKKVASGEVPPDWIREDGSVKGSGFLGLLQRPDGGVMSEYSVSTDRVTNAKGQPIDFPTVVPTLTKDEVQALLNSKEGQPVPQSVIRKAEAHALQRQQAGKSVWADPSEARTDLYPELKRAPLPDFLQQGSSSSRPAKGSLQSGQDVTALMTKASTPAKATEPTTYAQDVGKYAAGEVKGFMRGVTDLINPQTYVDTAKGVAAGIRDLPAYVKGFSMDDIRRAPGQALEAAGAFVQDPEAVGRALGNVVAGKAGITPAGAARTAAAVGRATAAGARAVAPTVVPALAKYGTQAAGAAVGGSVGGIPGAAAGAYISRDLANEAAARAASLFPKRYEFPAGPPRLAGKAPTLTETLQTALKDVQAAGKGEGAGAARAVPGAAPGGSQAADRTMRALAEKGTARGPAPTQRPTAAGYDRYLPNVGSATAAGSVTAPVTGHAVTEAEALQRAGAVGTYGAGMPDLMQPGVMSHEAREALGFSEAAPSSTGSSMSRVREAAQATKLKLTAAETKAATELLRQGQGSPTEIMQAIQNMRVLSAGLPSDAEVARVVAAKNARTTVLKGGTKVTARGTGQALSATAQKTAEALIKKYGSEE